MTTAQSNSICFLNEDLTAQSQVGETILEIALRLQIPIAHSCGGFATCGTCRIKVKKGLENCHERNELEAEMASDRGFSLEERLACQTTFMEEISVEIPKATF